MPQDIEWAYAGGTLYCLQARPITTLAPPTAKQRHACSCPGSGRRPAAPRGKVRVLRSPDEGAALQAGEILVAPMTTPDWVPVMRRAAGLVTDGGGMTCHAAIVSRELRIPCVVGARTATKVLRDGELVTVDGQKGQVLRGALEAARPPRRRPQPAAAARRRSVRAARDPRLREPGDRRSAPRRSRRCRSTAWASCAPSS